MTPSGPSQATSTTPPTRPQEKSTCRKADTLLRCTTRRAVTPIEAKVGTMPSFKSGTTNSASRPLTSPRRSLSRPASRPLNPPRRSLSRPASRPLLTPMRTLSRPASRPLTPPRRSLSCPASRPLNPPRRSLSLTKAATVARGLL